VSRHEDHSVSTKALHNAGR